MPPQYRVAVIGHTGRGDYGHGLDRVWLRVPNCQVVAVADADDAGRQAAAARLEVSRTFADYRRMLDDIRPDVVSIGPRWLDQHCDMVLAAAERKIHVYLEKPLCRSPVEADAMVSACQEHGIKLALAHTTRYSPKLSVIRNLIEDGRIGRVLEIRARGKEDPRGGGEDLWVLGSHVLNLMAHIGGPPEWCFAHVTHEGTPLKQLHVRDGNEGIGPLAGDHVQAMYGLPDGATGYFGSRKDSAGGRFGLQIFGSRGIIELLTGYLPPAFLLEDPTWSPGRSGQAWVPISSAGAGLEEPLATAAADADAGNIAACQDLLQAIELDREPECNVYEGRVIVDMIAAVFTAHLQGAPVRLPLAHRQHPLAPG